MAFSVANPEIRWAESVPSQTDLALSILQCVKHVLNSVYITDPKSFNRLAFGLVSFHTIKVLQIV